VFQRDFDMMHCVVDRSLRIIFMTSLCMLDTEQLLPKPVKSAEEKAKWAAYIREYRKRRKLAAAVANSAGIPDGMAGDQSSPVATPDAA